MIAGYKGEERSDPTAGQRRAATVPRDEGHGLAETGAPTHARLDGCFAWQHPVLKHRRGQRGCSKK